jgi:hypothetical protein
MGKPTRIGCQEQSLQPSIDLRADVEHVARHRALERCGGSRRVQPMTAWYVIRYLLTKF